MSHPATARTRFLDALYGLGTSVVANPKTSVAVVLFLTGLLSAAGVWINRSVAAPAAMVRTQ